jgi:hypothetical protein
MKLFFEEGEDVDATNKSPPNTPVNGASAMSFMELTPENTSNIGNTKPTVSNEGKRGNANQLKKPDNASKSRSAINYARPIIRKSTSFEQETASSRNRATAIQTQKTNPSIAKKSIKTVSKSQSDKLTANKRDAILSDNVTASLSMDQITDFDIESESGNNKEQINNDSISKGVFIANYDQYKFPINGPRVPMRVVSQAMSGTNVLAQY